MKEHDISGIKRFLDDFVQKNNRLAIGQSDVESNLRMKYSHILAVHALAQRLAAELQLDDQTTFQVRVAALLHDIGRFPQIVESQTYEDIKSVNHANLGVRIIQENGVIDHFGIDVSEAIEIAVRHHNKLTLPPEIVGKPKTIAEILRDSDKIDIIRIAIEFHSAEFKGRKTGWYTEMSFSPTCNRIAAESLLAGKVVPLAEIGTVYDEFLLYLSWVNDLHFDVSVCHLVDIGCLEYMVNSLPDDTLRNHVAEYISRRITKRCSIKI
jgi:putative nucleotidyltransferase with HDIG domain